MIHSIRRNHIRAKDKPPPTRLRPSTWQDQDDLFAADIPPNLLPTDPTDAQQHDLELARRILGRIESQLPGRVRNLTVYTTENAVVLAGQCSTFYTKQLAQHAAMGVLEYERLINNIDVRVAK